MIGRLRGLVAEKGEGQILLDVQGVGYVVHCSDHSLAALASVGTEAVVHTEFVVREDLMQLYGFATISEREWFRLLVSVQGVGAKAALAILGTLGVSSTARALTLGDTTSIRAAPGVGPKLAARICNELKEKAALLIGQIPSERNENEDFEVIEHPASSERGARQNEQNLSASPSHEAEAISALVNLGYDRMIAAQTVTQLGEGAENLDTLIKGALRALAGRG